MKSSDIYNAGLFLLVLGLGFILINHTNNVVRIFPLILMVLSVILFVAANVLANKEKDKQYIDETFVTKQLNWNEIFQFITEETSFFSPKSKVADARAVIVELIDVGDFIQITWRSETRAFDLSRFKETVRGSFRLYYSEVDKIVLLFLDGRSGTEYCFIDMTFEEFLLSKQL